MKAFGQTIAIFLSIALPFVFSAAIAADEKPRAVVLAIGKDTGTVTIVGQRQYMLLEHDQRKIRKIERTQVELSKSGEVFEL